VTFYADQLCNVHKRSALAPGLPAPFCQEHPSLGLYLDCFAYSIGCIFCLPLVSTMSLTPWTPGNYLPARRSDHVDIYTTASKSEIHVPDPYQWLEENSDEVDKWTTAQAAFTQAYLDQNADRQKLEDKFRASMNYAKVIIRPLAYILSSSLNPFPVVLCANST